MSWVRVGKEPRHHGRLGEDLAVVRNGWHESAGIDGQVLGCAWYAEVDDDLLEGDLEFLKRDVRAVGPWGELAKKYLKRGRVNWT